MKDFTIKITQLLSLSLIICGCSSLQEKPKSKTAAAIQAIEAVEKSAVVAAVDTDEVIDSLLPAIPLNQPTIVEEKFDVSVNDNDIRSFLLSLVDATPYNIIVSPELDLKISLQLNNVSVSEVLSALQHMYPVMVEQQKNLFYVSSAETTTMVYPVNYINLSRKGKSETRVSGQIAAGQSNQQNSGQASASQSNVMQQNASEIKTQTDSDFWRELQNSLQLIIRDEEKANIVVSPQVGVIIVKALPRTQKIIQDYLNVTQSSLNRQVILEAKIIEVTLSEGFQTGIDWSKMNNVNDGDLVTFGQSGQVLQTASSDAPLNGIFSLVYQGNSFNGALQLLKTQGDVQVLSSPRVSTVNNHKAVIKVGSDEFFVTDISTTTVTGTSTSTTPDVTLTPFFSGISLDVIPQIDQNGEIILHIHPVVSEVTDQQKTLTLGQDQINLPLALTNVRESDSIVRAKNNQIIVIGGLMQNKIQNRKNSVPILGDIPLVGRLFSQTRDLVVKSELVILLKTSLVNNDVLNKDIQGYKQRLQNM